MKKLAFIIILLYFMSAQSAHAADTRMTYDQELAAVQKQIKAKNYSRAEQTLRSLLLRHKDNRELLSMLGSVLLWEGKLEESLRVYDRLMRIAPSKTVSSERERVVNAININKARTLLERGDIDGAEAILVPMTAKQSTLYSAGILLAPAYLREKQYDKAERLLENLRARYPKDSDIISMRTSLHLALAQYDQAIKLNEAGSADTVAAIKRQQRLSEANRLYREGKDSEALAAFESLFEDKINRCDTGYMTGVLRMRSGDTSISFLESLRTECAGNKDILLLIASAYYRTRRFTEAIEMYTEAGEGPQSPEIIKVQKAIRLSEVDALMKEGREREALVGYEGLFRDNIDRCGTGQMIATLKLRAGETQPAIDLLEGLKVECADNRDVMLALASAYFRAGMLQESIATYRQAGESPDSDNMRRAQKALRMAQIEQLMKDGQTDQARQALRDMLSDDPSSYDAGFKLGMSYFSSREFSNSTDIFGRMRARYPEDTDFAALHIESLILSGQKREALGELNSLPQKMQTYLMDNREDLYYRATSNYIKVYDGAWDIFYGDLVVTTERNLSIESGLRISNYTAVIKASRVSKYDLTDTQAGVDIYAGLGERAPYWGYISFNTSPEANFLPEYSIGAEVYTNRGPFEYSMGYTKMVYANSDVDILKPSITYYAPQWVSLTEKLYYVPEKGSYSLDTTLNFELNHKFKAYASYGFGSTSELSIALGIMQEIPTSSWRAGAEFRFMKNLSVGAEFSEEYRDYQLKRSGGALYTRLWW